MEKIKLDCVVIGAGVIGLAIARRLALSGREVIVLEKEASIGTQTSSRNSEVIHAGIYYPKHSLKARLCVEGKQLLYAYCAERHIPHKNIGKLIVATSESQRDKLKQIQDHAHNNGVSDLRLLDKHEIHSLEPQVHANSALFSPSTGIIDSHALMLQLQTDVESNGGQCVFNSSVSLFQPENSRRVKLVLNENEAFIEANLCINATGLDAVSLASNLTTANLANSSHQTSNQLPQQAWFAKGSYFSYCAKVPFERLIYPVPEPGGLGVHLTLDLNGRARFGPDVEWLDIAHSKYIDYQVDEGKRDNFYQEVKKYWPDVQREHMQADYSGVRPKLVGPGMANADFLIQGPQQHGIEGFIHLAGFESPGLTSCLAIAEYVERLT